MINNRFTLTIFIVFLSSTSLLSQSFDKQSVLDDLEFLYYSLDEAHYNLFAYTDKKEFTDNFIDVKESVKNDSLSMLEVITFCQRIISKANTGHAEVDFPIGPYREYAMGGGTVFPLEIAIEGGQALIRKNFSNSDVLAVGLEIVSIDGVPIHEVIQELHLQLSAETPYFKNAKLEFWSFPRLYWQVFGQKDSFELTVQKEEKPVSVVVPAVDLINGYEMVRTDIISAERLFKMYGKVAYLKPGNFSGDEVEFKHFIDSVFTEIGSVKTDNLVIDLRNNAGGHNAFSDHLVSYFADKPFKWHSSFTLKSSKILKEQTRLNNDTTDPYFKQILERKNGEIYEYEFEDCEPQAKAKQFQGKVYVLVNRHSYSMAAVTAAMIQDYGFATIVGEATGDFPTLYASQFQYTLPKTGVVIKVPKGYIIRPNTKEEPNGVIPDLLIKDHLVDETDEILLELLKKIGEQ